MEGAVQVAGFPDHGSAAFNPASGLFEFKIRNEDGDVMPVTFDKGEPGNFDQAKTVVVVGRLDEAGTMEASQILVKCPSKYEERGEMHPDQVSRDKVGTSGEAGQ